METLPFGVPLGTVMQVCYVVEDIEREMERWTRLLGVGPFFFIRHFPLQDATHRGEPTDLDLDVALAFSGSTCLELIRQNDRGPSVFREAIETRGYGFHHWGIPTRSFDADVARYEKNGARLVSSGKVVIGARAGYVDTGELGGLIELIEFTPPVDEFFGMIHAAAQSWDGTDPVRSFGPG